ncbi:MAG: cytochrome c3 family protein [Planctomycetes bacterium]|nr:cytochrome c3 family protein [Planctomycetota bacterium]
MKHVLRLASAALATLLVGSAFGQITNTPHNLNNFGVTVDRNQVCLPCHVPHNAYPYNYTDPLQRRALWNHAETTQTFTMYTTTSGHTGTGPEGPSKMCLSCHDGVTAVDNYGGTTSGSHFITGSARVGTDLSNDHPIGIAYPTGDPGYNDPSGFQGVQLVTINGTQRVECTSCHEPHNNSMGNFLRRTLNESRLCLECHNK